MSDELILLKVIAEYKTGTAGLLGTDRLSITGDINLLKKAIKVVAQNAFEKGRAFEKALQEASYGKK